MRVTRRQALVAAAGAAIAAPAVRLGPARAAEFVYKFAHGTPEAHPFAIRLKSAIDEINAAANGRLQIQLFPNAQLGIDAAMLSQVRSGSVDFYTTSGISISSAAGPASAINAIPFAFKSYAEVWPAMDGALGTFIRASISRIGLRVFEKCWDSGYRQITTSTKPITSPDDLKGFKMRVPIAPINTSLFKALGASPVTIDFNELYTALQSKIADGNETPIAFVYTGRLYEVQKYCSITNHIWDGSWIFANPNSWNNLPKDLQELVDNKINGAAPQGREDVRLANDALRVELEKKGMVFNEPALDPFRAALKASGFYTEWKGKLGAEPWSVLEKFTGPLT